MSNVPDDLRYVESDEWLRLEGDLATVGVTDYAQGELGDIVYVELPEPGRVLQRGESFGSVESVKTVSELYAPVSGEVVEANPILAAQSEKINSDPYGEGWMVKIRLSDESEREGLLDADGYRSFRG